jgi:hypothetical protein
VLTASRRSGCRYHRLPKLLKLGHYPAHAGLVDNEKRE